MLADSAVSSCKVRCGCLQASACTVTIDAPACTTSGRKRAGASTIRCASTGIPVEATAARKAGPTVSCGQKLPSITSTWAKCARPEIAASSAPSRVRSAVRIPADSRGPEPVTCSPPAARSRQSCGHHGRAAGRELTGPLGEFPDRGGAAERADLQVVVTLIAWLQVAELAALARIEPARIPVGARLHRDHVGPRAELPPGDVMRQLVAAVALVDAEPGGPVQHGRLHVTTGAGRHVVLVAFLDEGRLRRGERAVLLRAGGAHAGSGRRRIAQLGTGVHD